MKEYKLLKKYPSLPKDWEVGMIVGYGDRQVNLSPCSGKYSNRHIPDSEVVNYPEYWEEVKPILITYDGVELFNGDKYWFIWLKKAAHGQETFKIYEAVVRPLDSDTTWSEGARYFSSFSAAEKYLKDDKKQFSLNDIKEAKKKLDCLGDTLIEYLETKI